MKEIQDVIIHLIRSQPFYAQILSCLNIREDNRPPVAGYSIQDGKIFLHINYFTFNQLNLENKTKVLIHEILHIIGCHSSRQRNREQRLWNIACDVAVNQMIEGIPIKQKIKFPVKPLKDQQIIGERNLVEKEVGGLTYDNVQLPDGAVVSLPPNGFAEEYYNILSKKLPPSTGQSSFIEKWEEKGLIDSSPERDLHPTWGDSQEISEELAEAIVEEVIRNASNKAHGQIPAHLKTYIEKVINIKTPWRRILQLFIAQQARQKRQLSFKKQNKRLRDEGLPGLKKCKELKVVVAVDTSGSISDDELELFAGEILKIKKCGVEVTLIECDCRVKNVYKLEKGFKPVFTGRGGTDFRPVWEYVEAHRVRPDAIIYLTDGRGQAPEKSEYPTLWALTPSGEKPWMSTSKGKKTVDWGRVIKMVRD